MMHQLLAILLLTGLALGQANEIPNIGDRRELFVDSVMIEKLANVHLQLHSPERCGVALNFDRPWEGKYSAYITILNDSDRYRMYYRGQPGLTTEKAMPAVTCYAESRDGIAWAKPDLGIYEIMSTRHNNVILANDDAFTHNFCPFIDTRPGIPASERYKAVAGNEKSGLVAFVSGDGIHWRKLQPEPVFRQGMFDSQNVAFWSESENCYVCYFRTWTGTGYTGYRTISRTTSADFIHWHAPQAMRFGATPMEHLYTNATQPYFRAPHIYIALPKRFFPDKPAFIDKKAAEFVNDPNYGKASSDAVLMTSRGGTVYDRTFMEAFIRPGPAAEDWVSRDNTPALGIVPANAREMYIYRLSHYAQPTCHVARYSLRTDGFISIQAPYDGGELLTKLLVFAGDMLEINFATSAAGGIQVEIQNEKGFPVPDFYMENCPEIIGDEIDHIVCWRHGAEVSKLAGQPIRLRFVLKDADLYSFRFKKTVDRSEQH